MKLLFVFSAIFITILISSCTTEGIVEDFSDMSELRDSLSKVFPDEDIRVKISNGLYIGISFVNSDLKKLGKEEKNKIAKKVGLITRHFFDEKRILDGSLTFVIFKNYIVFKYTEAVDTYDLWISDLKEKDLD